MTLTPGLLVRLQRIARVDPQPWFGGAEHGHAGAASESGKVKNIDRFRDDQQWNLSLFEQRPKPHLPRFKWIRAVER